MRFLIVLISTVLAACTTDPWQQQNGLPSWKILGLGNASCTAFVNRTDLPADRDPYVQWLWGYFTARNASVVNVERVLGAADINDPLTDAPIPWLERWCAERPDVSFQQGVLAVLAKEVRDMRIRRIHENARDPLAMPALEK